jgi:hypothetical protein
VSDRDRDYMYIPMFSIEPSGCIVSCVSSRKAESILAMNSGFCCLARIALPADGLDGSGLVATGNVNNDTVDWPPDSNVCKRSCAPPPRMIWPLPMVAIDSPNELDGAIVPGAGSEILPCGVVKVIGPCDGMCDSARGDVTGANRVRARAAATVAPEEADRLDEDVGAAEVAGGSEVVIDTRGGTS